MKGVAIGAPMCLVQRAPSPRDGWVWVPSHLCKLVYDQQANRAWAHWRENSNEARIGQPIKYRDLGRRTGIEFLPGLQPKE